MSAVLDVDHVTVRLGSPAVTILDDVSLRVDASTVHALIGESGSGKTTLAKAATGLVPIAAGAITLAGETIRGRPSRSAQAAQMVFQDPFSSLDPRYTTRRSLLEAVRQDTTTAPQDRRDRVDELCDMVALPAGLLHRLPSQLSGGQCQRVAIARAIAPRPALLVADEITSSLDVTVQMQIIELIERLAAELRLSVLFITHDLAIADRLADDITVLQRGRVVEQGTTALWDPRNPYTQTLVDSLLQLDRA
jgi:peptide/nickel transport system ATP-binding protein